MTYSCCAIKCGMLCYEFLLLSSHVKNSAANQRLQWEVSCWLCFLGQKGDGHKCIQGQYNPPGERETARISCMFICVCTGVFSLYKISISSTNFENAAPGCSTSVLPAVRLTPSLTMSLFYQLTILNLGVGEWGWGVDDFSGLTLNCRRQKHFC